MHKETENERKLREYLDGVKKPSAAESMNKKLKKNKVQPTGKPTNNSRSKRYVDSQCIENNIYCTYTTGTNSEKTN